MIIKFTKITGRFNAWFRVEYSLDMAQTPDCTCIFSAELITSRQVSIFQNAGENQSVRVNLRATAIKKCFHAR